MKTPDYFNLLFFKTDKYEYSSPHVCDFSNIPRPHFCMGLILEGGGTFMQEGKEDIAVHKGDMIFVPITSRYVSKWSGSPNTTYVSLHFAFSPGQGISEKDNYKLQKITPPDFRQMTDDYLFILNNQEDSDLSVKCAVLSRFFGIINRILPHLTQNPTRERDERIEKAAEYIERHSEENHSVSELARKSSMSVSNFYPLFKKFMGTSPIEYRNAVRIRRAMCILKSDRHTSVEELSRLLGFESPVYFRRAFKKMTGKTPLEYRKSDMEI